MSKNITIEEDPGVIAARARLDTARAGLAAVETDLRLRKMKTVEGFIMLQDIREEWLMEVIRRERELANAQRYAATS